MIYHDWPGSLFEHVQIRDIEESNLVPFHLFAVRNIMLRLQCVVLKVEGFYSAHERFLLAHLRSDNRGEIGHELLSHVVPK